MMAGICLEMMGTKDWQEWGWNKMGHEVILLKDVRSGPKTFLYYVLGIFHAKKILLMRRTKKMFSPLLGKCDQII